MKANNTYNVVIANEAYSFTSTKYNTTLTGFEYEAAHNAAKEALRDIAGELGYFNYKVIYSPTLDAWTLTNKKTQAIIMTAKIEEATETDTTPETSDTMNTETTPVEFSELSHAAQCTDIYLHNTAEIYQRYTVPAIARVVRAYKAGECVSVNPEQLAKDVQEITPAINAAVRLVKKYDHMTPTAKDIEQVTRNYIACIIDNAKYEVENV